MPEQQPEAVAVRADADPGAVVVVGAGLAGAQTAAALREHGHRGPITLVGEEPHAPYDRPPLSKDLLLGKAEHSALDLDLAGLGVELRLGLRATGLDPARRRLTVRDATASADAAQELGYDTLVLATGASPVRLPGAEPGSGVHLLRTHDDARALRSALRPGGHLAVVGAGWIGAEVATAARAAGCAVTVLEAAATPLAGALPPEYAERTRPWYAEAGAELRTGCPVAELSADGVRLADGSRLAADAVLLGVGARPATGWLAGSGIALGPDGAVLADAYLRASQPGVYAVGDCASFPSARYGRRLTVQHWDNALAGARVLAAGLTGAPAAYDPVPYFWSDQFGRMVQYLGHHPAGVRTVERGAPGPAGAGASAGAGAAGTGWSVLWLDAADLPVALLAVDRPRDLAQARRLIERGTRLDPRRAADPDVPLKSATAADS